MPLTKPDTKLRMLLGNFKYKNKLVTSINRQLIVIPYSIKEIKLSLYDTLTDTQKKVIKTAREKGYYDNPQRIGLNELSRNINLSSSTVFMHLKNIHNLVMSHFKTESKE